MNSQGRADGLIRRLVGPSPQYRQSLVRLAILPLSIAAVLKLGDEFRRLLFVQSRIGAIDLMFRVEEVQRWFAGQPVYEELWHAIYPPASHVLLWPLVGWGSPTVVRWIWAATAALALVYSARLIVRESGATTRSEKALAALILLSMNATGVLVGNGQLLLHILPPLLTAILTLSRARQGWMRDLWCAALLLIALVKPSVSLPFFWMPLLLPGGWRPLLLMATGYTGLTLWAASFQPASLPLLVTEWLRRGTDVAVAKGYANIQTWLAELGLGRLAMAGSLAALFLLGIWLQRHVRSDVWIQLGVVGIATRFWMYHHMYDDVLVALAVVALFRLAKRDSDDLQHAPVAGLLLATNLAVMLLPARLNLGPEPWRSLFRLSHTLVWACTLLYLLRRAEPEQLGSAAQR